MHRLIRGGALALASGLVVLPPTVLGQTVQYAYDAAGRLSVVADGRGDLAVYDYDRVGNIVSIRRIAVADAPDPVAIAYVSPGAAVRGANISIFGKGFGAAAETNAVAFNDVPGAVLTASPTRLTVRVPTTATTGPIRLTTPFGVATSSPFQVLTSLTITPTTAIVAPRARVAFVASADVRWSVDGIPGGDARRGTIGRDGVYLAPDTLPAAAVRVVATSLVEPALEASAQVVMITTRPLFVTADPLAIAFTTASSALAVAAPVALRVAPVVLSLTPSSASPGETVRLVALGVGFAGATSLRLETASGPDPTVSVSGLTVNADGTEAAADLAIAPGAVLGPRIVRIVTPAGASAAAVPGENVFLVH